MKVKEIQERLAIKIPTGRLLSYIKDGLVELNTISEHHINQNRYDIVKDKRFYDIPKDFIKIIDVRCKNHLNTKDEYRSIPRLVGKLTNKDADGE
tara:strand:+ start:1190 stop:1474 length:285 start_codon:yes stop_codon:yes gene_type:complete